MISKLAESSKTKYKEKTKKKTRKEKCEEAGGTWEGFSGCVKKGIRLEIK